MIVEKFSRKSFPVEAVQVTADNMAEVSRWCDGDIRTEDGVKYIKVRVHNPINERQTKAQVSDWVLYAGKGYKVYKDSAFKKSFDSNEWDLDRNVTAVDQTAVDPSTLGKNNNAFEQEMLAPAIQASSSNPGGTHTV